jgi:hypothetical protein
MATPNLTDWANAAAVDTALKYADVANKSVMLGSGTELDLSAGRSFSKTLTANSTLTVANVPADGVFVKFQLILKNAGNYTVTLWDNVYWPSGVTPTLSSNSAVVFEFITVNGGASYIGNALVDDIYVPWWLIAGLRADDYTAVYQSKGAVDLAASYVNLANPGTNDAQVGVAPTLDSSGWVFDGTTTYLIGPPSNSAGFAVRFSDNVLTTRKMIGARSADGTNEISMTPDNNASSHVYRNSADSTARTYAPALASGVIVINNETGALNGTIERSDLGGNASNGFSFYIGAANTAGTAVSNFQGKIQAACFFASGTTLTAAQIAALSSAMAAL